MATTRDPTSTEFTLDTAAELAEEEHGAAIQGRSPWVLAWRRLRRNYVALASLAVFVLIVIACAFAPVYAKDVAHTTPDANHVTERVKVGGHYQDVMALNKGGKLGVTILGPTWWHAGGRFVLGADDNGRDVAVRLLYGGINSLKVGIGSALICTLLSIVLALLAGYYRGWLDWFITRFFDLIWAFPVILLAIALGSALSIKGFHHFGIDIHSGWSPSETHLKETEDVGGVLLPRPFKVTRLGPISMFTERMEEMLAFYTELLGFQIVEEAEYLGKRIVYLRTGTEHHTLVLADKALRRRIGLSEHTSCLSIGMEVGSYSQLRAAVEYLVKEGLSLVDNIPPELYLGVDYAAHLADPDGHLVRLYYYMEQVGWDGKARPPSQRRTPTDPWPDTLTPLSDTYADQTYMGPLG